MKYETLKIIWLFIFMTLIIISLHFPLELGLIPLGIVITLGYYFQPSKIYNYYKSFQHRKE